MGDREVVHGTAVSLVVPVFDEVGVLPGLIRRLRAAAGPDVEVVLVDNGSSDGSSELISASGFRTVRVEVNRGLGFGVRSGLAAASGRAVVWMPGNGRVDPAEAVAAGRALLEAGGGMFLKARREGRPFRMRVRSFAAAALVSAACRCWVAEPGSTPSGVLHGDVGLLRDGPDGLSFEAWSWWRLRMAGRVPLRFRTGFVDRRAGASKWSSSRGAPLRFALSLASEASSWRAGIR